MIEQGSTEKREIDMAEIIMWETKIVRIRKGVTEEEKIKKKRTKRGMTKRTKLK